MRLRLKVSSFKLYCAVVLLRIVDTGVLDAIAGMF